jgi:hypothetical protein
MGVTYGFFNSINGDRKYNADDISNYFLKLISNGVFATPASAMQVQASSGMTVRVSAGWGFINCKWINNDSPYLITLDAADVVLNRIDRIVLRLNTNDSARNVTITVHKGTPASNPTAPNLTRANGVYELSLAQVYIAAGATAITQDTITDERANTSVCGYVTGLIDQIDTTNLFAQFTARFNRDRAEFNAWYDVAKEEVYESTNLVRKYTRTTTTTTAPVTALNVGIAPYTSFDILNVYVNGLRLAEGTEYTVSGDTVTFINPLDVAGTMVTFEVYKSIDSSDVVNAMEYIDNRLGGLSIMQISQADYDALPTKSPTTLYIIVDENE